MLLVQCGTTDIPRYYIYNDIFESKFFQKEWKIISFCLEREEIEEYNKNKQGYKYICAIFTPSDNFIYIVMFNIVYHKDIKKN